MFKLSSGSLPHLMDITDAQAADYVVELLEALLSSPQPLLTQNSEDKERRPSYEQALDSNKEVVNSLVPSHESGHIIDAIKTCQNEDERRQAFEIYKRFWLKEVPPISIRDYVQRFHRYCKSSAATYLTAGSLIYYVACELQVIPITARNIYRLFCSAFIIASKFIEDKLYPMSRYATTAGLKKPDLATLEISMLLLSNYYVNADREYLKDQLKKWALLCEGLKTKNDVAESDVAIYSDK